MTKATVINLPVKTRLVCQDCGALGEGSCNCGAPYVAPGKRAAEAVKANPKKSDRAIAAETGLSHATVSRARAKATVSSETVEPRANKRRARLVVSRMRSSCHDRSPTPSL
jgi:hypothetical protein